MTRTGRRKGSNKKKHKPPTAQTKRCPHQTRDSNYKEEKSSPEFILGLTLHHSCSGPILRILIQILRPSTSARCQEIWEPWSISIVSMDSIQALRSISASDISLLAGILRRRRSLFKRSSASIFAADLTGQGPQRRTRYDSGKRNFFPRRSQPLGGSNSNDRQNAPRASFR